MTENRKCRIRGDVSEITDFEALYKRVLDNFKIVMEGAAAHMVETQHLRSIVAPVPLLSAFLEGPVEKGKDMTQMGARFILGGTIAEGISHVIDSLCAIRRVVFQEKYCTMTELADAIDHNFEGNEKLRNKLDSCPKYGANEEEADEIGVRLTHDYAELMMEIDGKYPEMKFMPGIGTFSWYIAVGNGTGSQCGRTACCGTCRKVIFSFQRGNDKRHYGSASVLLENESGCYAAGLAVGSGNGRAICAGRRRNKAAGRPDGYFHAAGRQSADNQRGGQRDSAGCAEASGKLQRSAGPYGRMVGLLHHAQQRTAGASY